MHVKAKPGLTARLRARKKRKDDAYALKIRELVEARDGHCRYGKDVSPAQRTGCSIGSQWCHLWNKKRSMTRGLPPSARHSTWWTVMLCANHHHDEEQRRLRVRELGTYGCDGQLEWFAIGERDAQHERIEAVDYD